MAKKKSLKKYQDRNSQVSDSTRNARNQQLLNDIRSNQKELFERRSNELNTLNPNWGFDSSTGRSYYIDGTGKRHYLTNFKKGGSIKKKK